MPQAPLLLLLPITEAAAAVRANATAHTTFGALTGRTLRNGVEEYLGVPFALAERWGGAADWTEKWGAPRDALKAMPGCGRDSEPSPGFSEDCLYLNVWRSPGAGPLPVLFFIHGGSFTSGESSGYNCSSLAAKHAAVYVTANYRLGALGWLAVVPSGANCTPSADPARCVSGANFGLTDQQSALRWANREAAAFGGDSSRLMVFGESAGGISTLMHLLAPQSRGLFTRALSESGRPDGSPAYTAASKTSRFVEALGCKPGDLACMRKAPLSEVMNASDAQGWGFTIDGVSVPADPTQMFIAGLFDKSVSLLAGSNTNEGSAWAWDKIHAPYSAQDFRDYVASDMGGIPGRSAPIAATEKIVDKVMKRYPASGVPGVANRKLASDYFGDKNCLCPSRRMLRLVSTHSSKPAYKYRFDCVAEDDPSPKAKGVSHGAEVPFVFDHADWVGYDGTSRFTAAEEELATRIGAAWVRFADTGVPADDWPVYTNASEQEHVLAPGGSGRTESGWRADYCEFWDHFCDDGFCE